CIRGPITASITIRPRATTRTQPSSPGSARSPFSTPTSGAEDPTLRHCHASDCPSLSVPDAGESVPQHTPARSFAWRSQPGRRLTRQAMAWDPQQYLKFGGERLRPAHDLIARVTLGAPRDIVDLGCGTGTVTALLQARWPKARILGVDNSESMLERARIALPEVVWQQDILATLARAAP